MDGLTVYAEAVRRMIAMLDLACREAGLRREDLRTVVPHQANGRILHDVRKRMALPPDRVYSNVRRFGNTSSTSIPIALAEVLDRHRPGDRIGLTAFGGGLTFGAAVLEVGGWTGPG
jgi:3-oxoacyl-[acyl-carrier-protein] synthase III